MFKRLLLVIIISNFILVGSAFSKQFKVTYLGVKYYSKHCSEKYVLGRYVFEIPGVDINDLIFVADVLNSNSPWAENVKHVDKDGNVVRSVCVPKAVKKQVIKIIFMKKSTGELSNLMTITADTRYPNLISDGEPPKLY